MNVNAGYFWGGVAIVNTLIGILCMGVAQEKGYSAGHFMYGLLLGIFGLLYCVGLPDKILRESIEALVANQSSSNKSEKSQQWKCQKCGSLNDSSYMFCSRCGTRAPSE